MAIRRIKTKPMLLDRGHCTQVIIRTYAAKIHVYYVKGITDWINTCGMCSELKPS